MLGGLCIVLLSVLCFILAQDRFDYDFFFPNTYFKIYLDNCPEQGCKVSLTLTPNNTSDEPQDVESVFGWNRLGDENISLPQTEFPLTYVEKVENGKENNEYVYFLESATGLPDALEPGVYPNSAFIVNPESSPRYVGNFTFYKSQGYMQFGSGDEDKLITLNIPNNGIYAPGFNTTNYMPNIELNTFFNMEDRTSDENQEAFTYLKTKIDGVKKCDHLAIYGGDEDSQVLSIPTVFNIPLSDKSDKPTSFAVSRVSNFKTVFVSDNNFSYTAYPPALLYTDAAPAVNEEQDYIFLDFNWNVDTVNSTSTEKDGRLHFRRGDELRIESNMTINQSFLDKLVDLMDNEVDNDPHMWFTLALCHTNRDYDVWSYVNNSDCQNSTYSRPPPYKCELTASLDSSEEQSENTTLTFTQTESTRNLFSDPSVIDLLDKEFLNNNCTEKVENGMNLKVCNFKTDYGSSDSNPIPFRVVPLVGVYEKDSEIYRFIPLGPASKIYEIDLDVLPAFFFFLIVFLVITALCIICYFVGKVIVKKVKAKKATEAQRLDEITEESNRSMLDTSEESDNKKAGHAESEKLISNRDNSSSSSSSEEGKNVA